MDSLREGGESGGVCGLFGTVLFPPCKPPLYPPSERDSTVVGGVSIGSRLELALPWGALHPVRYDPAELPAILWGGIARRANYADEGLQHTKYVGCKITTKETTTDADRGQEQSAA